MQGSIYSSRNHPYIPCGLYAGDYGTPNMAFIDLSQIYFFSSQRKTAVDVSAQVQSSPVRMKQELSAQVDGTLDSSSEDDSLDFTLTLSDSGSAASGTESDELMKKMACIKQELAELESTSAKSPRDNSKAHSSSRASASKNYHKVHRSREREAKSSRDDQSVNDLRFKLLRNKGHSDERSESRSREAHSHHRRSQSPHSGGGSSLRRRDKHRDAYHRQETDHKHSHHIHSTSHESRSRHHDALRSSRHSPLRSSHRTGRSSPVSESRHSVRDHRPPREKFHHLSSSSSSRHERKERSSRSSDNKKSEESKWRHREESPSNSDHVSSKDKSSYHDKGNDTKLSAGGKSCTVRLERMTLVDEKLKLQADREPSSCSNNESDSPSSDGRQGSRTNGAIDSNPTQGYQLVLERHVRQLFIRGDNVVLISILE